METHDCNPKTRNPKRSSEPMRMTRRNFLGGLGGTASAAAALTIVPRHVLGGPGFVAPSDKLTLGCIGVGAQGTRVMTDFLKEPDVQIVAVCDVNRQSSDYSEWGKNELRDRVRQLLGDSSWGSQFTGPTAGREPAKQIVESYYAKGTTAGQYHGCAAYDDFRELLHTEKDLDAVMVCTPDHWHAPISISAMKMGKHTYCQKPMTHSVYEARRMAEVARETKVATQVAIGNSASEGTRALCELVWSGVIGPVRQVKNWSSRPFWPQGLDRPKDTEPVPDGLDWDLWLGPAPERPYNHIYLPFVWRGWYDFGQGALGDMGNYSFDTIFRVLKLTTPVTVEASSTEVFKETFPSASLIHWEFPARTDMPAVKIHWYDGGLRPPRPDELEPEDWGQMGAGENHEGMLLIGDHGKLLCGFEGQRARLLPESRMKNFTPPPKTLPRSIGHYREWIEAAKGGKVQPEANFEFESSVVEALLLGNVALRTGEKLRWDSANLKVPNVAAADALVSPGYRGDWGAVIKG
ncbi:MAG TPA: Gfo/Idh/MocA family oxidoreductase [Terriglobia bacterium]|nr:Gfo/Idh/MocA family oxidoreductase [Terriglobia bacterium]